MTTEVTEGMPTKPGVLPADEIAEQWWQGQFGRYTYDNHVTNATFMRLLDEAEEDTYFPCDIVNVRARYKFRNKTSERFGDSRIIYESLPKSAAQKTATASSRASPSTNTMMSRGITKEVKCMKMTEGSGDSVEAINAMLADQEWTLFSTVTFGENNKSIVFTFIR